MTYYSTLKKSKLTKKHYENFPVATLLFPKKIRDAATILYQFARSGDDIADEGNLSTKERLKQLNHYQHRLDQIKKNNLNVELLFMDIYKVIQQHHIPIILFQKFIDAFKQDITTKRYSNYKAVSAYCDKAAAPAGEMILSLFTMNSKKNIRYSNSLCQALALIGMSQDFHVDILKNRLYIPMDEMKRFNLKILDIQNKQFTNNWKIFKKFWLNRIELLLKSGSPLGEHLDGRLALQVRIMIAAAHTLVNRMKQDHCNLFNNPPTLSKTDWFLIFCRCIFSK